ncbi:hypothetical protein HMPREF3226_02373 [Prevotella corporis]|uniref:Uncharacterized protein n=1 Tax=Prevotella corporis TaxID=28128 RepID=A0A133PWA0_9BACT|nr:hypothetical protein HMPREF3226_02373 [Prevotella corporis]
MVPADFDCCCPLIYNVYFIFLLCKNNTLLADIQISDVKDRR